MDRPIYEVFLVLHPVSSRLGELAYALEPLVSGEPSVAALDVYYRAAADTALVALHYDERDVSGDGLRRLDDVARGSGLTIVDPARLPVDERRTFFESRLPQFEPCARGRATVAEVLTALAARIGVVAPPVARATPRQGMPALDVRRAGEVTGPTAVVRRDSDPPPISTELPRRTGRMVVTVPPLPPLPPLHARHHGELPPRPATLPPPPPDDSRGTPLGRLTSRNRTVTDRMALTLVEQAKRARRAAEAALRAPPPANAPTEVNDRTAPMPSAVPVEVTPWGDGNADVGAAVVGIHAVDTAPLAQAPTRPRAPSPDPRACGPHPRIGTDPIVSASAEPPPASLDVRFLRGSDWVPVRARALSARGAYIVTSAPARLGDTVHVSVACAGRTALVRGTVYHVTTADDAVSTGASGFALRFPEYACPARTHLVQVLLAARQAGVTLRPPPNRTSVRFPVRWPVHLATAQVAFRAEAQDISAGGMFVATQRTLDLGLEAGFAMTLDLDVPIEGRARVARLQDLDHAEHRGMREGFGVQIVSMSDADRARWDAFLGRVRRRTEKRVLVGASPGRVQELAAGLFAAGYTVTSGSDLGLLMRVAELDPCPPDIAVIDADFDRSAAPSGWIEQVFASRQVQCVTVRSGDVRRARSMVDRLLLVES